MILILSENDDLATNDVIEWLTYYEIPYVRINETTKVKFENIRISNDETYWELNLSELHKDSSIAINSNQITGFWYRRGYIGVEIDFKQKQTNNSEKKILPYLIDHINYNQKDLIDYVYYCLSKKTSIGKYSDNFISKLKMLTVAVNVGLKVPDTHIISSKDNLSELKSKYNNIITKGIKSNGFNVGFEVIASSLTQKIELSEFSKISDHFSPSLIQNYIEKEFELRIFYLCKKCYCVAIFSQNDKQTHIDFRNYNEKSPNRIVPYTIPEELNEKIIRLMKALELNSGSLDFIYSKKNEYVFLEVNPVGQFTWISKKCNLQLDKEIAQYFMKYEKRHRTIS
ncbi:MAG: grasp-with-spasm system ATP-grasp peptide maturase [Bacteroidia bacterium]|nr:grasp-with-spasm system ATP-grasp peptide maturase [Bacteroidia bacterium]